MQIDNNDWGGEKKLLFDIVDTYQANNFLLDKCHATDERWATHEHINWTLWRLANIFFSCITCCDKRIRSIWIKCVPFLSALSHVVIIYKKKVSAVAPILMSFIINLAITTTSFRSTHFCWPSSTMGCTTSVCVCAWKLYVSSRHADKCRSTFCISRRTPSRQRSIIVRLSIRFAKQA